MGQPNIKVYPAMAQPNIKVYPGGLMRCCLETLHERMQIDVPVDEGDILPCKYHPDDKSMIFRDGAWRWNAPTLWE